MFLNYIMKANGKIITVDMSKIISYEFISYERSKHFSVEFSIGADYFFQIRSESINDIWIDAGKGPLELFDGDPEEIPYIPHALVCFMSKWKDLKEV